MVKTSLLTLVSNTYSLDRYLKELSEKGLINIREEKIVRKTFYISLTPKGRMVAEQLKKAEEIVNIPQDEIKIKRPKDKKSKVCVNCHTSNESDAIFCKHCGVRLG